MKLPGMTLLRDQRAVSAFERQDPEFRQLVFYSEGAGDWPHLGPIVDSLLAHHDVRLSYLTSDDADPGLSVEDPRLRAFNIGAGTARTILFARMDCRYFVMTLPDLGNLWLKRSVRPVHYVYAFHSMNSTHTSYRKGAFDNFDTILCVGPHHTEEIRKTEQVYGLPEKRLVEHGSVKLDTVLNEVARSGVQLRGEPATILVAPTWGPSSLIEQPRGPDVLAALLKAGFRTILRLHPMTVRRLPKLVPELRRAFGAERGFTLEEDMGAVESWLRADVMVSDWSGAATEYALALGRPVIYIDTPPKVMNPEWDRLGLSSFEASVRDRLGRVIAWDDLEMLGPAVAELRVWQSDVSLRDRLLFYVGQSATVAAEYLAALSHRAVA
jgi:YidC/Oxa1 family membrane protein insertase